LKIAINISISLENSWKIAINITKIIAFLFTSTPLPTKWQVQRILIFLLLVLQHSFFSCRSYALGEKKTVTQDRFPCGLDCTVVALKKI
jgi:hypothetical protein